MLPLSHTLRRRSAMPLILLALQACGTATGPGSPSPPGGASTTPPPRGAALATERKWLQSWFEGTPVVIGQARDDAPISVEVPREFSFVAGRSSLKPALTAVLDKVAESLRRTPSARLPLVAAPGDEGGTPALALQRASQVRAHLMMRGVRFNQIAAASATSAPAVQLRIELAAP